MYVNQNRKKRAVLNNWNFHNKIKCWTVHPAKQQVVWSNWEELKKKIKNENSKRKIEVTILKLFQDNASRRETVMPRLQVWWGEGVLATLLVWLGSTYFELGKRFTKGLYILKPEKWIISESTGERGRVESNYFMYFNWWNYWNLLNVYFFCWNFVLILKRYNPQIPCCFVTQGKFSAFKNVLYL